MSYRQYINRVYCTRCDKRNSHLCSGCIRVSGYNKDGVPIGFNSNDIENIPEEY